MPFRLPLILAGFLALAAQAWPAEPVKIGVILSMSGPAGTLGARAREGIRAASRLRPAVLGRPVHMILVDVRSEPGQAVLAAFRLVERDKVCAIVGDVTASCTLAVSAYTERHGIPLISLSGPVELHGLQAAKKPQRIMKVLGTMKHSVASPRKSVLRARLLRLDLEGRVLRARRTKAPKVRILLQSSQQRWGDLAAARQGLPSKPPRRVPDCGRTSENFHMKPLDERCGLTVWTGIPGTDMGSFSAIGCHRRLGARTAAIVQDNSQEYSMAVAEGFAETFKALGGAIVRRFGLTARQTGMENILLRVKQASPDVVFTPLFATQCALLKKQAARLGIETPIMATDRADPHELIGVGGTTVTGLYVTCRRVGQTDAALHARGSMVRSGSQHAMNSDPWAAAGAYACDLLLHAIERSQSLKGSAVSREALLIHGASLAGSGSGGNERDLLRKRLFLGTIIDCGPTDAHVDPLLRVGSRKAMKVHQ